MTGRSDSGRPFPGRLGGRLTPEALDALGHPYRRQILRALHRDVSSLSPPELTESGLLPCSLSAAVYHLEVLENAGLVGEVDAGQEGSVTVRHFASRVEAGSTVAEVLRETDDADRQRLAVEPS